MLDRLKVRTLIPHGVFTRGGVAAPCRSPIQSVVSVFAFSLVLILLSLFPISVSHPSSHHIRYQVYYPSSPHCPFALGTISLLYLSSSIPQSMSLVFPCTSERVQSTCPLKTTRQRVDRNTFICKLRLNGRSGDWRNTPDIEMIHYLHPCPSRCTYGYTNEDFTTRL